MRRKLRIGKRSSAPLVMGELANYLYETHGKHSPEASQHFDDSWPFVNAPTEYPDAEESLFANEVASMSDDLERKHDSPTVDNTPSVLVSLDLLPCIFSTLELNDCYVAAVCRRWRAEWQHHVALRRWLRPYMMPPDLNHTTKIEEMVTLPDSRILAHISRWTPENRLLGANGFTLRQLAVVNERLDVVEIVEADWGGTAHFLGVGEFLYITRGETFCSFSLPALEVCETYTETKAIWSSGALSDQGLLFVFARTRGSAYARGLLAFDSDTLELKFAFPDHDIDWSREFIMCMAVIGNELFVPHTRNSSVCVFDLSGTYLREIRGAWQHPNQMCVINDRLCLSEVCGCGLPDDAIPAKGRRLFVITPDGATYQTYHFARDVLPQEQLSLWPGPRLYVRTMHFHGGRLLVLTDWSPDRWAPSSHMNSGHFALAVD